MEKNENVQEMNNEKKTAWQKAKTAGKWLLGVGVVVGSAVGGWYAHKYSVKEDLELAQVQRDYQARRNKNND